MRKGSILWQQNKIFINILFTLGCEHYLFLTSRTPITQSLTTEKYKNVRFGDWWVNRYTCFFYIIFVNYPRPRCKQVRYSSSSECVYMSSGPIWIKLCKCKYISTQLMMASNLEHAILQRVKQYLVFRVI